MNKSILLFQGFLNKAILYDQTHLVNIILLNNKQHQHFNEVHNGKEYKLSLSDGELEGCEAILLEKQMEVSKELLEVNTMISNNRSATGELYQKKQQLENDQKTLEEAQSRDRYVHQWLLIPYWLGEELINWGEVVFRSLGCNYWGITYPNGDFTSKESILQEIFEELHT